ncbi:DNA polymerase IV [Lachnospiraceae bacterium KM106-2]|nr:DNA polymerase IV [Lachnospiraceae bacterium KM106-2]
MEKVIFHVDVNSAFLSWEAAYRLAQDPSAEDIRKIPAAIGGDVKKRHGIILAKSNLAKQYGIKTGMPIVEAVRLCPMLYLAQPNFSIYSKRSSELMQLLKEFAPVVEQFSIDEAFLDMSHTELLYGEPMQAAHKLKDRIKAELGFTVNIGVSNCKLLAKMASDFTKPDRVHSLFPEEVPEKMWPLPVEDLFFVGRATGSRLRSLGITTIGELAKTDVVFLRSQFKKHGELIHEFANGRDVSIVSGESRENKGYGNSTTIPFDVEDAVVAKMVLLSLSETVATRLRKNHVETSVVSVEIVDNTFHKVSKQKTLLDPTNVTNDIYEIACSLFEQLWNGAPIRLLGIQTAKVSDDTEAKQLSIFDYNREPKLAKLDQAVDQIRGKFGDEAIMRASFINAKIQPMQGKKTRDKK